ncbi:nuclear transport factor 2 family protein [Natrialbaceae archaeon A-arb3/5]
MYTAPDEFVRAYYEALRRGEALEPFFLDAETTVKFGISEALFGYEAVADALREQTATTTDWTVESDHLVVDERDGVATVADEVTMAWTDTESGESREFDSRWSGTLHRTDRDADDSGDDDHDWAFATMHVSAPAEL